MSLLAATIIDASIALTLGLMGVTILRRRSAALRHAILVTAIVAALAMPLFELLLPQIPILRLHRQVTSVSSGLIFTSDLADVSSGEAVTAADRGLPWIATFVTIWGIGAVVLFSGLAAGLFRLQRLRARCTTLDGRWRELTNELAREIGVGRQVALLRSPDPSLLVTCGVLRPAIILPASADGWSADRARVVLRHELAHIKRHDAAIQLAGETLRVLHWIDPLAWITSSRLRRESEHACDDAVLRGGVEGTDYATHLLEVARQLSGRPSSWASAHAIAHSSTLERRIVAMLQQRNRASLNRRDWIVAALAALAVSIPLTAIDVTPLESSMPGASGPGVTTAAPANDATSSTALSAPNAPTERPAAITQAPAAISGRVLDQLGGAIPGVQLTLTDPRNGTQLVQQTNASGDFMFRDLPPGRYELLAAARAFTTVRNVMVVGSGETVQRAITLPLGTLKETITISCSISRMASAASAIGAAILPTVYAQDRPAAPVRVGGNVKPPLKVKDVRPVCPADVPPGDTLVTLSARIGVDGFVNDVNAVPADSGTHAPAELIESAMDAVRQWKFTPTLLDGQPVPVEISVNVTFKKP